MTEYIFDVPDSNQPIAGDTSLYYPDERDEPMMVREEIVRCRDCACFDDEGEFGQWCTQLDFGKKEIEDGFCAWGTKKEDE